MKLTNAIAQILARVAEAEAKRIGVPMAIAITDAMGETIHFTFMDDTLPVSREIALSKAHTAAVLRMSTRQLGEISTPGQPLYGIETVHQGKLILFGGGFPLVAEGKTVGAIGISGGSVEEDEEVARPAVDLFADMAECALLLAPVLSPEYAIGREELELIVRNTGMDERTAAAVSGAILLATVK